MKVQLFDRGSPQGKQLFSNLEIICKRHQIDYDPEYIKDMSQVYNRGLQGKTVLLIDNQVVLIDEYPSALELDEIVSEYIK
jgi:hypothetical protein